MLKLYFLTLPILLGLDALRLGVISKSFYKSAMGSLMKTDINRIAWWLFYLLFSLGLVFFVLMPSIKTWSRKQALLSWALFGLVAYATYDLTNLATLKGFPLSVTLVDLAWGTAVSGIVSLIVYLIIQR